jgi:BA14K-like protein
MRAFTKLASAILISGVMLMTSLGSAIAMPYPSISVPAPKLNNVEEVQYRHHRKLRRHHHRSFRHHRHHQRHYGHYGRRHHNRSNAGAILGGLAAGAIIGGVIANQPRRSYSGSSHQQWCANRYRTYRAYDNTYVPRVGHRAYCVSPYS